MRRFLTLVGLEIKKSLKLAPKLIASSVLVLLAVVAIASSAGNILGKKAEGTGEPVVSLGVVCDDNSWMMDLAKGMLLSNKKINAVVKIDFTDRDAAMAGLEDNEYMAVVIIPDNAVKDIISGKNTPFDVVFPENAGYEAAAIKEVADGAVNLLASAQAGIYSVYDFYELHNRGWFKGSAIDRLNDRYIANVLQLDSFFDDETVVATGDLNITEYYILSGLILFMLLFGMNSLTYMEDYKREIIISLEQNGVGIVRQITARFAGFFCLYCLFHIPAVIAVGVAGKLGAFTTLKLLLGLIPVLFVSSAIVLFIQITVKYKPAAVILTFLLAVVQSFVTGGFIPKMMLPSVVGRAGEFTPAHFMAKEFEIIYLGTEGLFSNTLILFAMWAALMALSAAAMKVRKGD